MLYMCVSLVELEFVVCCRGTGEASVLRLTPLSVQTSSNMVGKNYFSSSSSGCSPTQECIELTSDQQG